MQSISADGGTRSPPARGPSQCPAGQTTRAHAWTLLFWCTPPRGKEGATPHPRKHGNEGVGASMIRLHMDNGNSEAGRMVSGHAQWPRPISRRFAYLGAGPRLEPSYLPHHRGDPRPTPRTLRALACSRSVCGDTRVVPATLGALIRAWHQGWRQGPSGASDGHGRGF